MTTPPVIASSWGDGGYLKAILAPLQGLLLPAIDQEQFRYLIERIDFTLLQDELGYQGKPSCAPSCTFTTRVGRTIRWETETRAWRELLSET
jgi:hypothetical protein